jgi:hypothetical protein
MRRRDLSTLDGQRLAGSCQTVDLPGASIGAWRRATACLANPAWVGARLQAKVLPFG